MRVFDDAGRLSKVEISGARTAYYAYDSAGLLTRMALPGDRVMSYFTYDQAGRLEQLENHGSTYGTLVSYFSYARNAAGAVDSVTHEGGEATYYGYDELDRLTAERRKSGATTLYGFTYSWDATSNKATKTDEVAGEATYYTYSSLNLRTREHTPQTAATTYFTYDQSQRMEKLLKSGDATYFSHNPRNMVTEIKNVSGSPDALRTFAYTGAGEAAVVQDNAAATPAYWAYDGERLLSEKDNAGSVVRRYRHDAGPAASSVIEVYDSSQGALQFSPAMDERGSVNQLVDSNGAVANRYIYDAFGLGLANQSLATGITQRAQFLSEGLFKLQTTSEPLFFVPGGALYRPKALMIGGGLEDHGLLRFAGLRGRRLGVGAPGEAGNIYVPRIGRLVVEKALKGGVLWQLDPGGPFGEKKEAVADGTPVKTVPRGWTKAVFHNIPELPCPCPTGLAVNAVIHAHGKIGAAVSAAKFFAHPKNLLNPQADVIASHRWEVGDCSGFPAFESVTSSRFIVNYPHPSNYILPGEDLGAIGDLLESTREAEVSLGIEPLEVFFGNKKELPRECCIQVRRAHIAGNTRLRRTVGMALRSPGPGFWIAKPTILESPDDWIEETLRGGCTEGKDVPCTVEFKGKLNAALWQPGNQSPLDQFSLHIMDADVTLEVAIRYRGK